MTFYFSTAQRVFNELLLFPRFVVCIEVFENLRASNLNENLFYLSNRYFVQAIATHNHDYTKWSSCFNWSCTWFSYSYRWQKTGGKWNNLYVLYILICFYISRLMRVYWIYFSKMLCCHLAFSFIRMCNLSTWCIYIHFTSSFSLIRTTHFHFSCIQSISNTDAKTDFGYNFGCMWSACRYNRSI